MTTEDIIIGIDGGGTCTRVMVCDVKGNVLSYVEGGAASIYKDSSAKHNVHTAITKALEKCNQTPQQVIGMVAGIAGYDSASDLDWIVPLTDIPELMCTKWHVNDAMVAHYGALMAQPGIVVISGTGSIIVAITEDGSYLRNYDFHHYAASAARFISYDAIYEILAGNTNDTDRELLVAMQQHWQVESVSQLSMLASKGFESDQKERNKKFGKFAPYVTNAAQHGSSVAITVCNRAISQIKVGIELLAPQFSNDTVNITCIGGVINSPYFMNNLSEQLQAGNNRKYHLLTPKYPPVIGAVLLAMKRLELSITNKTYTNLEKFQFTYK